MMILAYASVDCAMIDPKPQEEDAKKFQEWKTSNRVYLITLKRVILEAYPTELKNKDPIAKELSKK